MNRASKKCVDIKHFLQQNDLEGDSVRKPGKKEPLALTVEEAGKRLGLGRAATYAAINRGELPHLRIGRRVVVPIAALEQWLSEVRPKSSVA